MPLWLVPLFALPGTRLSLTCPMFPPCATPRRFWCLTIALVVATMQMACQCCWALPLEAVPSTDPKYDHMLHMNSYSQLHFRANPADEWVLFKAVVAREAWCVSRGCAAFSCPRGGVPLRGTDVSVCTSSQGRRGDHACPDDWPSPSDGAIGLLSLGTVGQCKLHAQAPAGVIRDEHNNLVNTSISFEDGVTTLVFERAYHTDDPIDLDILRDAPTRILMAHGTSPVLNYHGPHRGLAIIDFRNTSQSYVDIPIGESDDPGSGSDTDALLRNMKDSAFAFETALTSSARLRWVLSPRGDTVTFRLRVQRNSWYVLLLRVPGCDSVWLSLWFSPGSRGSCYVWLWLSLSLCVCLCLCLCVLNR